MPDPRRTRALSAAAALALALTLGACSAGSSGSSAQMDSAGAPAVAGEARASDPQAAKAGDGTTVATPPKLIKQAQVDMTVDDIPTAAGRLRSVATANGGSVTNEYLQQSPGTSMPSTMTISVPADKLDVTVDQVAEVGTVVSRSASTDDVTAQYVDTQARIESMQRSVDRLRTLIGQATTVTDIAAIESELTRREADLDALKAQMKALEGNVAQSTVAVSMSTRPDVFEDNSGGFMSGLRAGWRAFLTSIGVLLTVVGALLPFAVAAAVIVVPLVVVLRRRHRARAAGQPPASGPFGPSGPAGPGSAPTGMPPASVGAASGPPAPSPHD